LIRQDPKITQYLTPAEITTCFDPQEHLKNLEQIYQRLDI
jgi:adenylosuccinate lyase